MSPTASARRRALGAAAFALALLAAAPAARACSCYEIPFATEYAASEAVFTARSLGQESAAPAYPGMHYEVLLVEAIWKGALEPTTRVLVEDSQAVCGFTLATGLDYLVFADQSAAGEPLRSHLCTRTRADQPGDPIFDQLGPPQSTPAHAASWGGVKAHYR